MKVPELYVHDVQLLLAGLMFVDEDIMKRLVTARRAYRVANILMPWRKSKHAATLVALCEPLLSAKKAKDELFLKLLESTGLDENQNPVSFMDLIKNSKGAGQ